MRQVLSDLLQRLLSETGLSLQDFVWGTLCVCLFFSTTHLASMLMTRWGDHRASGKALLFSILIHVACIAGVCGVTLKVTNNLDKGKQVEIPVRKIVLDDKDQEPSHGENDGHAIEKRPLWDKFAPTLSPGNVRGPAGQREFVRSDVISPEGAAAEAPERSVVAVERPTPDLPDLPRELPAAAIQAPRVESPVAEPAVPAPSARPTDAAIAADGGAPTAEARPEATVPSAGARGARGAPARGNGIDAPVAEKPSFGGPVSTETVDKGNAPSQLLTSLSGKPGATTGREGLPAPAVERGMAEPGKAPRIGPAPVDGNVDGGGAAAAEAAAGPSTEGPGVRRTIVRKPAGDGSDALTTRTERSPAVREGLPAAPPDRDYAAPSLAASTTSRGSAPGLERTDVPFTLRGGGVPSTYRLRSLDRRREVSRKYGGTEASEKAVENSLKWFASIQEKDGSWDGDKYGAGQVGVDENKIDRKYAGRDCDPALSSLAILSFLGAGHTHEEGPYAPNVERGLQWLISQQTSDGYLGGRATRFAMMYSHGMATYALAEAYGMQSDPAADALGLREPLRKAVIYIIENQNDDGGWRYVKGTDSDMSMFGWQLMALKSAEIAGIRIPEQTRTKMVKFLTDRSLGSRKGLAGYRFYHAEDGTLQKTPPTAAMTAEALFCKQMLGIARSNPQSREAVDYILSRPPRLADMDEYYWYYGTLAMYQFGGPEWEAWNGSMRDLLVEDQVAEGTDAGSWRPRGLWGRCGGRIYQTALSTLCLEVYYRFLPLYQLNGAPE